MQTINFIKRLIRNISLHDVSDIVVIIHEVLEIINALF